MKEFGHGRGSTRGSFIVDRRGTILGFDQGMEQLTGWPAIEIVGRDKELGGGAPLYEGQIPLTRGSKNLPLTLHCRNGRRLEIDTVMQRLAGPGERVLVTSLRVLSSSPSVGSSTILEGRDALTGLPDSEAFAVRLADDLRTARTGASPIALLILDIDHLRRVNDRFGHGAGDEILQKLSGVLRVMVKDETRLFRLGGDDFAVLMPDSGRGDARQLAAGLRSTVERYRFVPEGDGPRNVQITLSIGAASYPADADSEQDLMERARDALEEARSMGRNRVWCYLRRPRVPVQVPVFFDGAESLLVGYTRDLSPSGIFVQTSAPVDVGMRCALAFPLPGHHEKVHVIGRVVRTVPPEISQERAEVHIPGMGVEFERFGGNHDRRTIDSFLHSNESTTLRPETGPLSF